MQYFVNRNIESVSNVCDAEMRESLERSFTIRDKALTLLTAMPGYKYKSLKWKNRYYEYWKRRVINGLASDVCGRK